jgi:YD repeat-containing protein
VVNKITINNVQTSYDNNGNLTKTPTFSKLQWDAENRLVKAEVTPTSYYSFTYDGLNRRIGAKYTNQGAVSESRYLWCGEKICQKRSNS